MESISHWVAQGNVLVDRPPRLAMPPADTRRAPFDAAIATTATTIAAAVPAVVVAAAAAAAVVSPAATPTTRLDGGAGMIGHRIPSGDIHRNLRRKQKDKHRGLF